MKRVKEVTLRSDNESYYSGKKLVVDAKTNFVHFARLVKIVCKNDQNSDRFWKRLKPDLERSEWKQVDEEVYISPSAVDKLTTSNAGSCKKTWGVFHDDGLSLLLHDLGHSSVKKRQRASNISPSAGAAGSSKAHKKPYFAQDDLVCETEHEYLSMKTSVLNERERNLNKREELLNKRGSVLSIREVKCTEKEEEICQTKERLDELEKRLNKKEQEHSVPDVSKFIEQVSSLANKFKAKVSRSRRNSSEEPKSSPTPSSSPSASRSSGSDSGKGGEGAVSPSPSRSPSAIPGSEEKDEPVLEEGEEVRRRSHIFD